MLNSVILRAWRIKIHIIYSTSFLAPLIRRVAPVELKSKSKLKSKLKSWFKLKKF